jgi:hypothetical protein
MREARGARRYNTLVTLTYAEKVTDEFGHASYDDPIDIADVYVSVEQMSATKTMMTFQQADVIGLEIELREPNVVFNGLRYKGHQVNLNVPSSIERGRILRLSGWYQVDR